MRRTRRLGFGSFTDVLSCAVSSVILANSALIAGIAPVSAVVGGDLGSSGLGFAAAWGLALGAAAGLAAAIFAFAGAGVFGTGAATCLAGLALAAGLLLVLRSDLSVSSMALSTAFSLRRAKRCSMILPRS